MRLRGKRERGAVLLLVLGTVAVLAALAVELAARAAAETALAARLAREAAFRRLARSGLAVARGLLVEPDVRPCDFWGEPWNEEVRLGFGPGEEARVRVFDESGKLNVVRQKDPERLALLLARLFEYLRRTEPGQATERLRRAEAQVLARLLPGDGPAEPLFTLDGLREAGLSADEVFGPRGLCRYLTTFGDGKVNLNTAPRAVLYALDPDMTFELASRIASWRGDPEGAPGVYKAFETPQDLRKVEGVVEEVIRDGRTLPGRDLYRKLEGQVSVRSTAFSVELALSVGDRKRRVWAFFEPGRAQRPGEPPKRTLSRLAWEEVGP